MTGYYLDKMADGRWHITYWRYGEFIRHVCQCASEDIGREQVAILNWLERKEEAARIGWRSPWS